MSTLDELINNRVTEHAPGIGAMAAELGVDDRELIESMIGAALTIEGASTHPEQFKWILGVMEWGAAITYYWMLRRYGDLADLAELRERTKGQTPC